jgi:prepilin-type N-terminal cleavage/methylation domain-containing protein
MDSPAPFLKKSKQKFSGFTLIEMLVVITLTGILFGIGLTSYNTFNRNQILQQAAEQLRSDLRLAQNKALAGQKLDGYCIQNNETLKGYRLLFDSATEYSIRAICSNGDVPSSAIKTVNLDSKDISITSTIDYGALDTGKKVDFFVLARGVGLGDSDGATITLTANDQSKFIDLTAEGVIQIR